MLLSAFVMPHRLLLLCFAVSCLALSACSPTFNWRELRPENTRLSLLLPCKAEKAQKTVPMGGAPVELNLQGCDTGDLTFAIASADVKDAALVPAVLAQWQAATLLNMKAPAPMAAASAGQDAATQVLPLKLAGSSAPPLLVRALGRQGDGAAVRGQAAYFAQGSQVFQAVIYGKKIPDEIAETFFASLKLE